MAAARAAAEQGGAARRGDAPPHPAALCRCSSSCGAGRADRRDPRAAEAAAAARRQRDRRGFRRAAPEPASSRPREPPHAAPAARPARRPPGAVRRGETRPGRGQPAARGLYRQALPQPRPVFLDLIQEGNSGPDAGRRQVRACPRIQVFHLCHLVDPPGDHPRHRRPEPHDPRAGAHGRHDDRSCGTSPADLRPAARPRADRRGTGRGSPGSRWRRRRASGGCRGSRSRSTSRSARRGGAVGDFVSDHREDDPLTAINQQSLQASIAPGARRALVPRAGDHPAAVRPRRRLQLHARGGGHDLRRDPRSVSGRSRPRRWRSSASPAARDFGDRRRRPSRAAAAHGAAVGDAATATAVAGMPCRNSVSWRRSAAVPHAAVRDPPAIACRSARLR